MLHVNNETCIAYENAATYLVTLSPPRLLGWGSTLVLWLGVWSIPYIWSAVPSPYSVHVCLAGKWSAHRERTAIKLCVRNSAAWSLLYYFHYKLCATRIPVGRLCNNVCTYTRDKWVSIKMENLKKRHDHNSLMSYTSSTAPPIMPPK